jgi:hypothetical protein
MMKRGNAGDSLLGSGCGCHAPPPPAPELGCCRVQFFVDQLGQARVGAVPLPRFAGEEQGRVLDEGGFSPVYGGGGPPKAVEGAREGHTARPKTDMSGPAGVVESLIRQPLRQRDEAAGEALQKP